MKQSLTILFTKPLFFTGPILCNFLDNQTNQKTDINVDQALTAQQRKYTESNSTANKQLTVWKWLGFQCTNKSIKKQSHLVCFKLSNFSVDNVLQFFPAVGKKGVLHVLHSYLTLLKQ